MRLFFALWPPSETAERLAAIARSAAEQFGGKPTRQETIHLTLAFLGEVPEEKLPLLKQTANNLRVAPFDLVFDHLAYWRHNHLLWAALASPSPALLELVSDLHQVLAENDFAVDGGNRPFTPHLTLVRKFPDSLVPQALPYIEPIGWHCSRIALVCSQVTDSGSCYQTLSDFPLSRT